MLQVDYEERACIYIDVYDICPDILFAGAAVMSFREFRYPSQPTLPPSGRSDIPSSPRVVRGQSERKERRHSVRARRPVVAAGRGVRSATIVLATCARLLLSGMAPGGGRFGHRRRRRHHYTKPSTKFRNHDGRIGRCHAMIFLQTKRKLMPDTVMKVYFVYLQKSTDDIF